MAHRVFSGLLGDLRVTLRMLGRNPGFGTVAVLTIALGIAANTAIFSVINSLFLHPPGVSDPARLVALRVRYPKLDLRNIGVSLTDYADVRDSGGIFSNAAALQPGNVNYVSSTVSERLSAAQVTWQWFDTFGAHPLLGRGFAPSDDVPGANHVVVLTYSMWQRIFAGDPEVVGQPITLNDLPYRIVGVMPREFAWPANAQLWMPLGLAAKEFGPSNRFNESYDAVARLAADVSIDRAQAFVQVLNQRVASGSDDYGKYARDSQWGMFIEPFSELVYGNLRAPLTVLAGTVGFVLLICCANVAALMLARASGRSKELAIRSALGAGRGHLVRQVMLESAMVAACGTTVGIAAAVWVVGHAAAIAPAGSIGDALIPIDRSVLLFSVGAGALSALLFGVVPAWSVAGTTTVASLNEASRSSTPGSRRQRARSVLVIAQVGLALVLLVGAGLFLKSLVRAEEIDPGFDPRGVITAAVSLDPHVYGTREKRATFYTAVAHQLQAQNGIDAAGVMYGLPFSDMMGSSSFAIEGRALGPGDPGPHSDISTATPGVFRALRIPLLAGRLFTDDDRLGSEPVVIIDENLARQYWPDRNPLDTRIKRGADWTRIVGVVGHVKRSSLAADTGKGLCYYPQGQSPQLVAHVVARTSADPTSFGQTVREAVRDVALSQAAVYDVKPMRDRLAASLGPRRFAVTMLTTFAAVALFMAALGLYGLVSYTVSQRTREIGVRIALGARFGQVLWVVMLQSIRLVLAGVVVGLLAASALGRVLASELVDVSAFDPLVLLSMCAVLIGVSLAATYVPARRAARVDPLVALRYE
jgi:predicted permease